MPYLVRKLIKRKNIDLIKDTSKMETIISDVPTSEFRTTNGCLSTWFIANLDDYEKAVLAIAITSSTIEKMDFIALDIEVLKNNKLIYEQTSPGADMAIPALEKTHYDITGLTLNKLVDCCKAYKDIIIFDEEKIKENENEKQLIRRVPQKRIETLINNAIKDGIVDERNAKGKIKEYIDEAKSKMRDLQWGCIFIKNEF